MKKIVTLKFNFVVVGCCGCCGRNENSILIVSMNHSHRPYCRFGLKHCATILIYHFPHLTLNVPLSLSLSLSLSLTHTHTFTFSLSLFHLYDLQILSITLFILFKYSKNVPPSLSFSLLSQHTINSLSLSLFLSLSIAWSSSKMFYHLSLYLSFNSNIVFKYFQYSLFLSLPLSGTQTLTLSLSLFLFNGLLQIFLHWTNFCPRLSNMVLPFSKQTIGLCLHVFTMRDISFNGGGRLVKLQIGKTWHIICVFHAPRWQSRISYSR